MKSKLYAGLAAVVCVLGLAGPAGAQGAKRTTVAVMDFDYGTVNHWWGQYDIGKGMADQVVDELVNNGTFRVIERKKLDTVLAEQDFAPVTGPTRARPSWPRSARSWGSSTSSRARSRSSAVRRRTTERLGSAGARSGAWG